MKYPELSADALAALRCYAAKHGRAWKSKLRDAWMGLPPHDDGGFLRALRNTHGPSWLVSFKFPPAISN